MRVSIIVLGALLFAISIGTLLRSASAQQTKEQNASPAEQQTQPSEQAQPSEGQASKSAVIQSVTGCVVQSEHGYSLKTASDTYPIETDKDVSKYVNKLVT